MKSLKIFIICLILFLLERVLFPCFRIFSFTPWLMFSFCLVSAALREEMGWWTLTAAVCGLVSDLAGGGAAGVGMAVYAACAVLVNIFSVRIFSESLPLTALLIFIFSILGELFYCTANYGAERIAAVLYGTILPSAAINTVFALIMYPLAGRLFRQRRRVYE